MSNSLIGNAAAPPHGWAEVRAQGQVVRYRRSGAGRPILLLQTRQDSCPAWPEILEALMAGFRLIVPAGPPLEADIQMWLCALLEGLGLSDVTIIAADEFRAPVLDQAFRDPDMVSAIVLLCADSGSDCMVSGMVGMRAPLPAIPLLLLHRDQDVEHVLSLLLEFLNRNRAIAADA